MIERNIYSVGNKGERVRSDCFIALELKEQGGVEINLTSKVKSIYGKLIESLCREMLAYFEIYHAVLDVEDSGALDFVIAARLEAVIKLAKPSHKEFLLNQISQNRLPSLKNRPRVTRLYLPGNTPSLMINSGIHKPDGVILDLEDAVAYSKKHEARFLVRNALRSLDFFGVERMVRINQFPEGLKDLPFIVPHNVNVILIPKCESELQIRKVIDYITKNQKESNSNHPIWLMPIIESAKGVLNCREIAKSSDSIIGMAIGLEDYTADLGVKRTSLGMESLYARMQLVVTCKALGIQAIDSIFSDIEDSEALKESVLASKAIGFEGMGCIHPRQIEVIGAHFAPTEEEIEDAKAVVLAFNKAAKDGLGVISLGTKMIDAPVVEKAQLVIKKAIALGMVNKNWDSI